LISQISGKVQDALRNSIEPIDIASSQIAVKEENLLAEDEPRDFSDEIEDSDAEDWKESIGDMTSKDNKGFVTKMDYADSNKLGAFSYDVNQKVVQDSQLSQTIQSKIPVTRKEIFTQVIEKAKVLLSGEKSEMVIDLKPDHLGKLALKIATERGIVVAKFVAENEQVKAALESNMNMLKESLEKQGFSVQEFSVFVGDNTERGGYGQNMQHGSHAKSSLKDELPAIGMRDVESLEQLHSEINSYVDGVSSINLTA
jgi:flagellar hook-length control protein FliK